MFSGCGQYQDSFHSFLCFFPPLGNDLGVAFEIPQHVKNQPFFASCVLKVQHHLIRKDSDNCPFHKKCLIFFFIINPIECRAEVQFWRGRLQKCP